VEKKKGQRRRPTEKVERGENEDSRTGEYTEQTASEEVKMRVRDCAARKRKSKKKIGRRKKKRL
jgi:hypothetical protein